MQAKAVVIVESPAKAKTLQRMLGRGFVVEASRGHVRDLPEGPLGVDLERGFEPRFVVVRGQRRTLAELKMRTTGAPRIHLATDPDREGEAVAWHLVEALDLPLDRTDRITFHEITEGAVREAFARPGTLDLARVHAQMARRVVDRLVGYLLSAWLGERFGRSVRAGRVQSAALRAIVEREREIRSHRPGRAFEIHAVLEGEAARGGRPARIASRLVDADGAPLLATSDAEARARIAHLVGLGLRATSVEKRRVRERPPAPFRTSTLIEAASLHLGFRASMTLSLAQRLFEGVEIPGSGPAGLLTYPRTDSTRVADEAVAACRERLRAHYGEAYVPARPVAHADARSRRSAHEAIRPTVLDLAPDLEPVRNALDPDSLRLYRLVHTRFVASQAAPARRRVVTVRFEGREACFEASAERWDFDGFRRILASGGEAHEASSKAAGGAGAASFETLDRIVEGSRAHVAAARPRPRRLAAPARFTDGSLVQTLERAGIGRPSTWASTISGLEENGFVDSRTGRLRPTALGRRVVRLLEGLFPEVVDPGFTARMERALDRIESGRAVYADVVGSAYRAIARWKARAERQSDRGAR